MKTAATLLFVLPIILGATPAELADPTQFMSAQRVIHLSAGGAFAASEDFLLADSEFIAEIHTPKNVGHGETRYELSSQKRTQLAPAVAQRVWEEIGKLGVSGWRKNYTPKDLGVQIFDGTQWSVYLRVGKEETSIYGDNVYPALSPLGSPVLEVDEKGQIARTAYKELLEIFIALEEEANQSPQPTPPSRRG